MNTAVFRIFTSVKKSCIYPVLLVCPFLKEIIMLRYIIKEVSFLGYVDVSDVISNGILFLPYASSGDGKNVAVKKVLDKFS